MKTLIPGSPLRSLSPTSNEYQRAEGVSRAAKPARVARFTLDAPEHSGTIPGARGDVLPHAVALTSNLAVIFTLNQYSVPVRLFFETFRRVGSANGVVRDFADKEICFPRRPMGAPVQGEILWGKLELSQALRMLRNPRYAGAYPYGRTCVRPRADGKGMKTIALPREEWHTLKEGAHPGYISWEEYEENEKRLKANAQAYGADRRQGPPREGPALLQGLVICGVCGSRMTVHYHRHSQQLVPEYVCQERRKVREENNRCQSFCGAELDRAIGELLVETMSPLALEVALSVQQELESRFAEVERLRCAEVERARYECELARRRYMRVDPDNRLVADSLEAEWNHKLRAQAEVQRNYERQCEADKEKEDVKELVETVISDSWSFPDLRP